VISASHNPPQYNGVKLFGAGGKKLSDADEEQVESFLDEPAVGGGDVKHDDGVAARYAEHVVERFGSDLSGLHIAVDCANGALFALAPEVFRTLGARVTAIGVEPDGANINVGVGSTDLGALQEAVTSSKADLGVAFDGDGDRLLAVDAEGTHVDGDQIIAILALHLGVDLVAVTQTTNLGFHQLMADHGISVVTTDVGDRYVLEALDREGGKLGGEQSGHVVYLEGHVTGDGLAAALLLGRALESRTLAEAAAVMRRFPQVTENVVVTRKDVPQSVKDEVERLNQADSGTRVLVRPSGTEPVIRVLAEAATEEEAAGLCGSISTLVRRELG
jgi:phosphoglucosamine mutase